MRASRSKQSKVVTTTSTIVTSERGRSTSRGRTSTSSSSRSTKSPKSKSPTKKEKSPARSKSPSRGRTKSDTKPKPKKATPAPRSRSNSRSRATEKKTETKVTEVKEERASRRKAAPTPSGDNERQLTPTRMSSRLQEKADHTDCTLNAVSKSKKAPAAAKKAWSGCTYCGTIGIFFAILVLPVFLYYLNLMCYQKNCTILKKPICPKLLSDYLDRNVGIVLLAWCAFHALFYLLPTGRSAQGMPSSSGKKLSYNCNGFQALVLSVAGLFVAKFYLKWNTSYLYRHLNAAVVMATIVSFIVSILLYLKARKAAKSALAPEGNSGSIVQDFFMGRELNPRIGKLDLKLVIEMRIGLIGWLMLDLLMCLENWTASGGKPNYCLWLVTFFHMLYIADALWYEEAVLTTIDFTHDGLGFMLVFGDLAWMPFLYSISTRFLLEFPQTMPMYLMALVFLLNSLGFVIFRGSNSQKNEFRRDPANPALAHLATLPTTSGKKLICGGWWGLVRHPNYLGDIIMSVAWALPCGFKYAIPWFYPVYLTILLLHREHRDEAANQRKYGHAWSKYCERVPFRVFPRIY